MWNNSNLLQQHSGGVVQTSGQDTESYAIFALARTLTDTVSASGGIRYIDEKKTFHTQYNQIVFYFHLKSTVAWSEAPVVLPRFSKSNSWDDYMGEATVDWQVNEDSLLYARWSRGFSSGGYSMRQAASESLHLQKLLL